MGFLKDASSGLSNLLNEMEQDPRIAKLSDNVPENIMGGYSRLEAAAYLGGSPDKCAELKHVCHEYAVKFNLEAKKASEGDKRIYAMNVPIAAARKLWLLGKGLINASFSMEIRNRNHSGKCSQRLLDNFKYRWKSYEIICEKGVVSALEKCSCREYSVKNGDVKLNGINRDEGYTKFSVVNGINGMDLYFPFELDNIYPDKTVYIFSLIKKDKTGNQKEILAIYNVSDKADCYRDEFKCSGFYLYAGLIAPILPFPILAVVDGFSSTHVYCLCFAASVFCFAAYCGKRKWDRFMNEKCENVITPFLRMTGNMPLTMEGKNGYVYLPENFY